MESILSLEKIPMKQAKKSSYKSIIRAVLLAIFCTVAASAMAALTLQGPSGFIQVPSHETVNAKEIELAARYRMYQVPKTKEDSALTNFSFAFSPVKDFEIAFAKAIDEKNSANDPDPLMSFKVRLPSIGEGEFSEVAFGGVFDANANNYHTLYLTIGGFGVGWNFGGNPWTGMANYGAYDKGNHEPESLCLLIGAVYPKRRPGERGYKGQAYIDYNGDVFSGGWRYSSHRGFWVDATVHSKSSYTDFYDYRPFILGLGANF